MLSRFTQVFRIIRHKSANGISLLSWSLSLYNSFGKLQKNIVDEIPKENPHFLDQIFFAARLCTLLMGSDNKMLLLNSIASFSGNLSVIICSVYYQNRIKIKNSP